MLTTSLCCLLLLAPADAPARLEARLVILTPEGEWLLRTAEDRTQSPTNRVRAVQALGRRQEPGSVPRLLRLLPGDGDVVTRAAIIALGQIGDRRALPVLRKLRDDPDVRFHGKINASLEHAVQALQRR